VPRRLDGPGVPQAAGVRDRRVDDDGSRLARGSAWPRQSTRPPAPPYQPVRNRLEPDRVPSRRCRGRRARRAARRPGRRRRPDRRTLPRARTTSPSWLARPPVLGRDVERRGRRGTDHPVRGGRGRRGRRGRVAGRRGAARGRAEGGGENEGEGGPSVADARPLGRPVPNGLMLGGGTAAPVRDPSACPQVGGPALRSCVRELPPSLGLPEPRPRPPGGGAGAFGHSVLADDESAPGHGAAVAAAGNTGHLVRDAEKLDARYGPPTLPRPGAAARLRTGSDLAAGRGPSSGCVPSAARCGPSTSVPASRTSRAASSRSAAAGAQGAGAVTYYGPTGPGRGAFLAGLPPAPSVIVRSALINVPARLRSESTAPLRLFAPRKPIGRARRAALPAQPGFAGAIGPGERTSRARSARTGAYRALNPRGARHLHGPVPELHQPGRSTGGYSAGGGGAPPG
jgi:hypothetical protein